MRSLVAITFTDKAAREMRNRVRAITADWLGRGKTPNQERGKRRLVPSTQPASAPFIVCALPSCALIRPKPASTRPSGAGRRTKRGWGRPCVEEGLAWAVTEPDVARLFSLFRKHNCAGCWPGCCQATGCRPDPARVPEAR